MSAGQLPKGGESFSGIAGALRESCWLASEDLPADRDVEATIEDVLVYPSVTFDAGRKVQNVPALKFAGKEKQLVLRTSKNRKQLVRMFGVNTANWRGKAIKLYVDHNVQFGGKTVSGIRIRGE